MNEPAGSQCRRPIELWEAPDLKRFGTALRAIRQAAGIRAQDLAARSEVSRVTLWRIEAGKRRTRESTIDRIAGALVGLAPWMGDPVAVADNLIDLAGPVLAPESPFQDRIERRRARRTERLMLEAERERRYQEWVRGQESYQRFLDEKARWAGTFLGSYAKSSSGQRALGSRSRSAYPRPGSLPPRRVTDR